MDPYLRIQRNGSRIRLDPQSKFTPFRSALDSRIQRIQDSLDPHNADPLNPGSAGSAVTANPGNSLIVIRIGFALDLHWICIMQILESRFANPCGSRFFWIRIWIRIGFADSSIADPKNLDPQKCGSSESWIRKNADPADPGFAGSAGADPWIRRSLSITN